MLVSQTCSTDTSHLNDLFTVCLISFDKAGMWGILITISDSNSCDCKMLLI